MTAPAVIGVYGTSNTGKTLLIEKIVKKLSPEGYKIATIKQTDKHMSLDTPKKDTWRHHKAGAYVVVFSSKSETDFLVHTPLQTSEIIRIISGIGCYDLILVEGANDPQVVKIQLGNGPKRDNTIVSYHDNFNEVINMIKKEGKKQSQETHLQITVNGKNIPLTEFPEKILTRTLIGMLSSLKGVTNIEDVVIHMNNATKKK